MRYKLSYNELAKLNVFQQISMLGSNDKTIELEDEAEYAAYMRSRRK